MEVRGELHTPAAPPVPTGLEAGRVQYSLAMARRKNPSLCQE